jgi:hypothetical protein
MLYGLASVFRMSILDEQASYILRVPSLITYVLASIELIAFRDELASISATSI